MAFPPLVQVILQLLKNEMQEVRTADFSYFAKHFSALISHIVALVFQSFGNFGNDFGELNCEGFVGEFGTQIRECNGNMYLNFFVGFLHFEGGVFRKQQGF